MLTLAVHCVVIQFFTTVGTVEQARKHTHDAGTIWPAAVLPEVLDEGESLPVNDGRVGVQEDFPFLLGLVQPLFLLKGLAERTKIHCIAHIFLPV